MRVTLSEKKANLLAPILITLLIFFIPISSSLKSIIIVPCLAALVFTPYYRHHLYFAFNTLWSRAALVLFLYIILACLWSEAPYAMRYNVVDKYSKLIFLPIFAVGFIHARTRQWALNSYIVVMIVTSVLSVLKARNLLILNSPDPGEVFYNHIVTGFMIALSVYFSGILAFKADTKRGMQFFYLFAMLLGSYQTFFINTGRTGYLAYAILMSLLILQKMSLKKAIMGMMAFFCMINFAYMLSPVMQERTQEMIHEIKLFQKNQKYSSLGLRIQFHQYAESLFKEHPLVGVGTGGFQYRFVQDQPVPAWGPKLNEPHGQYWFTLAEQGTIGIVLYLFFLGTLFVTAFRLEETKQIFFGLLISFCILSTSDTIFCYSPMGNLLIIFSALCLGELFAVGIPDKRD